MKNIYVKLFQALLLQVVLGGVASLQAATVLLDFENNLVSGGNLELLESGTDPLDDFTGDRFDERTSASFDITDIPEIGVLNVTATALLDDLNVTGDGLQDGPSGYDAAGEGTTFVFDRDVTVTELDWVNFTTDGNDSVSLSNGGTSLGVFSEGTVSGGIDFSSTNPSTMNIEIAAGDPFTLSHESGQYQLGQMTLSVPEPSSIVLVGFAALAGYLASRKRRS